MLNDKNEEKGYIKKTEERKIVILVIAIIAVVVIVLLTLKFLNGSNKITSKSISEAFSDKKTMLIYVENSDSKKCDKCNTIKKYLDDEKIDYTLYDVKKNGNKDYEKFLDLLKISKNDFNYPAILYIKDGFMYSNVINLNDVSVVEQFIKDYDLKK